MTLDFKPPVSGPIDWNKLLLGVITPDDIRRGNSVDWRFVGDFDVNLYEPKPKVDQFVDLWEWKVSIILGKQNRGMWIITGPRGSGKSLVGVTCGFYFHVLFDRPVASNFPLKEDRFGPCRTYTLDDIRDQLERLRALPRIAGTADWRAVNLGKYGIWLPGHVVVDDELHKEGNKRRPGSDEIKLIMELVMEIRHYDVVWIGLTPDKEILDAKYLDNDMFMSTEVKCFKDTDRRTGKQYVWGNFYANEGTDFQRISSPPDAIRFDVARFCNLYWTLGVGSSGAKLTKRPPPKPQKGQPLVSETMAELAEMSQGQGEWDSEWDTID